MSIMLPEERKKIVPSVVEDVVQRWRGKTVSINLRNCFVYKMLHRIKGWLTIFALNAQSEDVLKIREDLGLQKKPVKYNMHVSLLEKDSS